MFLKKLSYQVYQQYFLPLCAFEQFFLACCSSVWHFFPESCWWLDLICLGAGPITDDDDGAGNGGCEIPLLIKLIFETIYLGLINP